MSYKTLCDRCGNSPALNVNSSGQIYLGIFGVEIRSIYCRQRKGALRDLCNLCFVCIGKIFSRGIPEKDFEF